MEHGDQQHSYARLCGSFIFFFFSSSTKRILSFIEKSSVTGGLIAGAEARRPLSVLLTMDL